MVEPTHLKNICQIGSFPQIGGENRKSWKPPTRWSFLFFFGEITTSWCLLSWQSPHQIGKMVTTGHHYSFACTEYLLPSWQQEDLSGTKVETNRLIRQAFVNNSILLAQTSTLSTGSKLTTDSFTPMTSASCWRPYNSAAPLYDNFCIQGELLKRRSEVTINQDQVCNGQQMQLAYSSRVFMGKSNSSSIYKAHNITPGKTTAKDFFFWLHASSTIARFGNIHSPSLQWETPLSTFYTIRWLRQLNRAQLRFTPATTSSPLNLLMFD